MNESYYMHTKPVETVPGPFVVVVDWLSGEVLNEIENWASWFSWHIYVYMNDIYQLQKRVLTKHVPFDF